MKKNDEKPYVQTYTAVLGTRECNARCPYCISMMTPTHGLNTKLPEVDWINFEQGAKQANSWGASTILLTSKGELTKYPNQVREFLDKIKELNLFAQTEIQTNGIEISKDYFDKELIYWRNSRVTTVAISIAHYNSKKNAEVVIPRNKDDYIDLPSVIKKIRKYGLSVRLSAVMVKGYLDNIKELENLIKFAKENDVQQVTARPVAKPYETNCKKIAEWVEKNNVDEKISDIVKYFEKKAQGKRELVHGATIYYIDGMNLCLTNCLTGNNNHKDKNLFRKIFEKKEEEVKEAIRQLIYCSDGHVRTDWQYEGAIIF
jgi:molybdenum cofactor biosynthesis enzyme MoaA